MLILRDPTLANSIAKLLIRGLVKLRFAQVCAGEAYDYDRHGYMIVVELGDTAQALEQESSCSILSDPFDGTHYGNSDFSPSFDFLEEHDDGFTTPCYEMLFITNDDGFGITFFIPKAEGIDAGLLAMCAEYAKPAIRVI
ncbi:MAG: hypothetical protein IV084_06780 [Rugosibacter sp.]|nr:hypothetical protein [Rugosibacter sp.]